MCYYTDSYKKQDEDFITVSGYKCRKSSLKEKENKMKMKMGKRIISIDAETDGLWGNPFAVAAIVYDESQDNFDWCVFRLPASVVKNDWVKENVIPALENIAVTHESHENMLKDFAAFYMKYKENADVLFHMGHIVESHLFREMHRLGFIGLWDAPYVPIEVSAYLAQAGEKPDSVDSYAKKYNLEISDYGSTHNPLYDCEVAAKSYFHIINNR